MTGGGEGVKEVARSNNGSHARRANVQNFLIFQHFCVRERRDNENDTPCCVRILCVWMGIEDPGLAYMAWTGLMNMDEDD